MPAVMVSIQIKSDSRDEFNCFTEALDGVFYLNIDS